MEYESLKNKEEVQVKQTIQLPTLESIMEHVQTPPEQKPVEKLAQKIPEVHVPPVHEIPKIPEHYFPHQERKMIEMAPRVEEERIPSRVEEKASFAPLFVKLDRYRQILGTMNYLKNTMNMVKNTFSILNELEKIRMENLKLIQETIEKADKKIMTLDSEFMRPSGFTDEIPEFADVESLEATLVDLRDQVGQLKSELKNMA